MGKCSPSLRKKTLYNVERCNLSITDKTCIKAAFEKLESFEKHGTGGIIMADITFCVNAGCPFKDCERHMSRIADACIKGGGYVSVSNLDSICKRYISYLVEEADNG